MSNFTKALGYLAEACAEAGIETLPVIEIKFYNPRDAFYLETWLKQSLKTSDYEPQYPTYSLKSMKLYGFYVNITGPKEVGR